MGKLNSRSDAIGYKRPPAHGRFVKGKSGNPNGRPKGTSGGSALEGLINQTVTVTVDGISRKVPLTEAVTLSLAQRSLAGSVPAAREVMKIVERVEEKIAAEKKAREEEWPSEMQFVIRAAELRDCNTALQKLGVIEQYTDSWRICTWVIEAALARNSQLLLEEKDRNLIAEHMYQPEALQPILSKAA